VTVIFRLMVIPSWCRNPPGAHNHISAHVFTIIINPRAPTVT